MDFVRADRVLPVDRAALEDGVATDTIGSGLLAVFGDAEEALAPAELAELLGELVKNPGARI